MVDAEKLSGVLCRKASTKTRKRFLPPFSPLQFFAFISLNHEAVSANVPAANIEAMVEAARDQAQQCSDILQCFAPVANGP